MVQIFTCFGCDQEIERVVDSNANYPVEYRLADHEGRKERGTVGRPLCDFYRPPKLAASFILQQSPWNSGHFPNYVNPKMDAPKGKRVMSAKEFREYADECMRSAKMAKSVKERRDFLQKAEA